VSVRENREAVVAEDDASMAALVAGALERDGWRTHIADNGVAAVELVRRVRPRVAVLDVNLPLLSGYEVCHSLRAAFGAGIVIVFLSGERREAYDRVGGLLIGADDYMTKPFASDELLVRIRGLVARDGSGTGNGNGSARTSLTNRELDVLRLLAGGLKQTDIAARLVISPKTVGGHVERILEKLGAHSRAQAVALAYQQNLVSAAT
jgi:DNA-binding NarL/FixJ family response regulator